MRVAPTRSRSTSANTLDRRGCSQAAANNLRPAEEFIQAILKGGRLDLPRSCCRSTPAASPHALLKFFGMALSIRRSLAKHALLLSLIVLLLCVSPHRLDAQTTRASDRSRNGCSRLGATRFSNA